MRFFILKYASVFSAMSIHFIHNFYNMLQFLTMCYKMFKQENRAFQAAHGCRGLGRCGRGAPGRPWGALLCCPPKYCPPGCLLGRLGSQISLSHPRTASLEHLLAGTQSLLETFQESVQAYDSVLRTGPSFLSPVSQNFSAVLTSLLCLLQHGFPAQVHPVPVNSWTGPG